VPAVVDLAAMRDALVAMGGAAGRVNPLVPVELVIDHSVIAESSGRADSFNTTSTSSTSATSSATKLLRWAQQAFDGFRWCRRARASATR